MDTLQQQLVEHGATLVFVAVLLARAGAPIAGGPVLVIAGALAALGQMSLPLVVVLSLAANLAGDAVWFAGGRKFGYRVMRLLCRISLSPDTCVRQSEGLLTRWGGLSLIAAKFVPGVSVVAAPVAGALGMSWRRFIAWDLVAGAVWTAAYVAIGVVLRDQVEGVLKVLADAGTKALLGLAVLAAAALLFRWLRRRAMLASLEASRISPEELYQLMAGERQPTVLDVRRALAQDSSDVIPGALCVELDKLRAMAPRLGSGPVVVYCDCPDEAGALKAASILEKTGVADVRVLVGGYDGWAGMLTRRMSSVAANPEPA